MDRAYRNPGSPMEGPGDPSDGRRPSHSGSGTRHDRSRKRERLAGSLRRPFRPGGSLGLERRLDLGKKIGIDGPGRRRFDPRPNSPIKTDTLGELLSLLFLS